VVADVVRTKTRSIDVAARYGGDEIALMLLETDFDGAVILAERLRTGVKEAGVSLRNGRPMGVTISIGVATLPASAVEVDALVDAADDALLRAKRAGKDQIRTAPGRARDERDRPTRTTWDAGGSKGRPDAS
jgi:diguanylate cyclase (GGDEF)-like protein